MRCYGVFSAGSEENLVFSATFTAGSEDNFVFAATLTAGSEENFVFAATLTAGSEENLVLVLFTWRNTLSIQNTGGAITISMQTVCYNYARCTGELFRIVVDWAGSFRLADAIVARGNGSIRRRLVAAWALALRWLISRRFDA